MKTIAVLVSELTNDYNLSVFEGIESFFRDKDDVRLVVATLGNPEKKENSCDYLYWTALDILNNDQIDAIIVITNSFLSSMKLDELSERLSVFKGKPIFSVATPLAVENSFYTHTVCNTAYDELVTHMVKKHGKKKIAFFSAGLIDSPDSDDRLAAYKAALVKNGLVFNPELLYKGDFSPGTSRNVIYDVLKDRKDNLPFDAILCANDFTAGGILLALRDLGIDCPGQIAVVGFDDAMFAIMTKPTLTSINQSISGSGEKAAEMAYRYLNGGHVDDVVIIQSRPVYRQSCGCITTDLDTSAYIDDKAVYHTVDERVSSLTYTMLMDKSAQNEAINRLVDTMNTRISFNELVEKMLKTTLNVTYITDLFVCLYDVPVECSRYDDFFMPEEAHLILYADKNGIRFSAIDSSKISFNPHERLVPAEYSDSPAGKYFLMPMTMHETNYGYMWVRLENRDNAVIPVDLKILTNILIQAVEFQRDMDQKRQLISSNHELNLQSKTDELTQILNRRGFFDNGQKLIDQAIETGKSGAVFFCDLDGLKTINDTYGHDIGDLAIATEAKVLTAMFRDTDMVGRLSGDEFGVVAPDMKIKIISSLRERLISMNEKFSKEAGLPFTLSISIGPIEFNKDNSDLRVLLSKADDNLYIEKKEKHGERR